MPTTDVSGERDVAQLSLAIRGDPPPPQSFIMKEVHLRIMQAVRDSLTRTRRHGLGPQEHSVRLDGNKDLTALQELAHLN